MLPSLSSQLRDNDDSVNKEEYILLMYERIAKESSLVRNRFN